MELKFLRHFKAAIEEGLLQGPAARLSVAQPHSHAGIAILKRNWAAIYWCEVPGASCQPVPDWHSTATQIACSAISTMPSSGRVGRGRGVRIGLAPDDTKAGSLLMD